MLHVTRQTYYEGIAEKSRQASGKATLKATFKAACGTTSEDVI